MDNMDYKQRLQKIKEAKTVNSGHIKSVQNDIATLLENVEIVLAQKELQADHKEILNEQRDKLLDINNSLSSIPTQISETITKALFELEEANSININKILEKIALIEPIVKVDSPIIPKPTVIKEENIFDVYKPADVDETDSIKYYGYLANDGRWFIMTEVGDSQSKKYRFNSGKEGYDFNNRKKLKYDYIDKVVL